MITSRGTAPNHPGDPASGAPAGNVDPAVDHLPPGDDGPVGSQDALADVMAQEESRKQKEAQKAERAAAKTAKKEDKE